MEIEKYFSSLLYSTCEGFNLSFPPKPRRKYCAMISPKRCLLFFCIKTYGYPE